MMKDFKNFLLPSLILLLSFLFAGCIPSGVETNKIDPANVVDDGNGSVATKAPIFAYASSSASFVQNTPFAIAPSITYAGAGLTFSVIGTLPTGLTLNASNGMITGIPTSFPANDSYIILANNNFGSSFKVLSLVTGPSFSYSASTYDYSLGVIFSAISPTVTYPTSGVITYSVSPSLPTGLSLNSVTGEINGTPSANSATTSFSVTATSNGLSTTISVGLFQAGPPIVSYSSSYNYIRNTALVATPGITYQGNGFTISTPSGTLPTGLILNTSTGVISGTASAGGSGNQTFVVRVQNNLGIVDHSINFIEIGPPVFGSTTASASFERTNAFSLNLEAGLSFPAAANVTYSSTPALPNANCTLALDSATGVISGTIAWDATTSASDCARSYTITATNNADPALSETALTVTISEIGVPQIGYPTSNVIYTNSQAITTITPSYFYLGTLATPTAYAITGGSLPTGLALNASTGVISGTPTNSVSATGADHDINISVTNSFGTNTFTVTLEEIGPPRISYGLKTYQFFRNAPATSFQIPSVDFCKGGCTFSIPALPTGVAIDSSSGEISSPNPITTPINSPSYDPVSFTVSYQDTASNTGTITGFTLTEACNPGASFANQHFGGGGGTSIDPWFLCTEAHLTHMSSSTGFLADAYRLFDDIDIATIPTQPIGQGLTPSCFSGSFDGNDKIISNFKVYDTSSLSPVNYDAGFFSCLDDFDLITSLSFVNSYTYGKTYSGTLSGRATVPQPMFKNNKIQRVHAYRSVVRDLAGMTSPSQSYSGGLIGNIQCTNSSSPITLKGNLFHGTIHQDAPGSGSIFGGLLTTNLGVADCVKASDNAVLYQVIDSALLFSYNNSNPNPNSYLDYSNVAAPFTSSFSYLGRTLVIDLDAITPASSPSPVWPLSFPFNSDDPEVSDSTTWQSVSFDIPSGEYTFVSQNSEIMPVVPKHFCQRQPAHMLFNGINTAIWKSGGGGLVCP